MIGRTEEIRQLRRAYESDDSEFVAVYGRRRIDKTYLVNEVFCGSFR
jgi:AAA+ ATPase superfamily predicted ATPase